MTKFSAQLLEMGACVEARRWCGDRTAEVAWEEAPRADWMPWLARRLCVDVGWVYADLGRRFAAEAMDAVGAPNWADLLRSGPEVVDAQSAGEVESLLRFAAAYADAAAAARSSMQKRCADMVRECIPFATIEAALAKREAA